MASLIPSASASGTGSMTLSGPSTNSNQTVNIPDATGTMMVSGNMPAFSVYANASQSISSATYTKVSFQIKEFDTANCFDNTTNYRFTPNVAGYYQINAGIYGVGTTSTYIQVAIYKNGTKFKNFLFSTVNAYNATGTACSVIYLNGSTDYVEIYGSINGTSPSFNGTSSELVFFNGALLRTA